MVAEFSFVVGAVVTSSSFDVVDDDELSCIVAELW